MNTSSNLYHQPDSLLHALNTDGVVMLGRLFDDTTLRRMQAVYSRALEFPSWNTWIGYEQDEKWRKTIENLLIYDRSFVDFALDPVVCEVLSTCIGPNVELVEARGWETIQTKADFHGWHADAWYNMDTDNRPREIKLGCYLTDVETGQFQYIRGSHGSDNNPRHYSKNEIAKVADKIVNMVGLAGTCFLFDTSGIHRQSSPVLKKRWVVMYNYHDPHCTVDREHLSFGRYRPIILNSNFLAGLTDQQQRIIGIGSSVQKPDYQPRHRRLTGLHKLIGLLMTMSMELMYIGKRLREIQHGITRRIRKLVN